MMLPKKGGRTDPPSSLYHPAALRSSPDPGKRGKRARGAQETLYAGKKKKKSSCRARGLTFLLGAQLDGEPAEALHLSEELRGREIFERGLLLLIHLRQSLLGRAAFGRWSGPLGRGKLGRLSMGNVVSLARWARDLRVRG